ncbi:MAG: DEAD/DEAH box helicase, partial [Bacteroidota bacterium]
MISFNELGLKPEILDAVASLGFETPTPIQEKTIPAIIDTDNDIIALAQTGTGKTAAFGLPLLQQIDPQSSTIQSLILCPTRELCLQITKDIESYASRLGMIDVVPVYGGADITKQIRQLKKGCQIVVGTPGRMLDHIRRKTIKIENINWLVLDEADEMLNMGFKEDLDAILADTPKTKRTFLFSATMPNEIAIIGKKYMHNPIEISVGQRNEGAQNVKHEYYMVQARDRYEALKRLADVNPQIYAIIFCRTRRETKEVADKLMAGGYNADALHGDLSQAQRDYVMNRFRMKNLQLLVATDVAARGLDVNDLTHVINYNLPDENEAYVHRSGRTGRAGKHGISMSIIHSRESSKIKNLERIIGKKFEQKPVPGGTEICEKQLFNLIDRVEHIEVKSEQIEKFLPVIFKKLDWLGREDLIRHFVSVEFNRFLKEYKDARDLNVASKSRKGDDSRPERSSRRNESKAFSRFFINVGAKDSIKAPQIIGMINDYTRTKDIEIGRIDILKNFSFFEVDSDFEDKVLNSFKGAKHKTGKLIVELSQPD